MPRSVALLRGVSPMNCKMPELKRTFEHAGYKNVVTVLSSGNVVFDAKLAGAEAAFEEKLESAIKSALKRDFMTIVRPQSDLSEMIAEDPFSKFRLPAGAKRVVSFVRARPPGKFKLPIERENARILKVAGREIFTAYVPGNDGPVFMTLIEDTFGKGITTRTWDTLKKLAVK